ncbi:unnamed protein product [Lactuca saligna]|uniref:Protein kinase domain-containing protein n=1 Tax=Lactuca saligna TaxID=75948 RepID=A0AA35ZDY2_LACSI|nr:unnamed protein product [Lactuca saligna]
MLRSIIKKPTHIPSSWRSWWRNYVWNWITNSASREKLMLTKDQRTVKLVDFGLAREETISYRDNDYQNRGISLDGSRIQSNFILFVIVLWELLHNKLPFEGIYNLQATYSASFKNVRPSWMEDPDSRPNSSQIIQIEEHKAFCDIRGGFMRYNHLDATCINS